MNESDIPTPQFRVLKGEVLFSDEEDSVHIHYLQKKSGETWVSVLSLTLESGRSWGDEIDQLFRHRQKPGELLLHVSGFGYWGDSEYYCSTDEGDTWQPTRLRHVPDAALYSKEALLQVG